MNSANYKLIKTKLKGPEKPIIFVGSSVSRYTSNENEASIWSGLLKNGLERCVNLTPSEIYTSFTIRRFKLRNDVYYI